MDSGFLGQGMLSGCVTGEHFTAPSAPDIAQLITRIIEETSAEEVLAIVKNYTGDVLNFQVAVELLGDTGIACTLVYVHDDLATRGVSQGARGIAGTVLYEKILGAAATLAMTSEELCELAAEIEETIVSFGVCFRAPTTPDGKLSFDLAKEHAEIGVGIHGEKGISTLPYSARSEVISRAVHEVFSQIPSGNEPLIALVNNLGSAPEEDLTYACSAVEEYARCAGETIARMKRGRFVTSVDMDGLSLTLMRARPDILTLYDAPTLAPAWSE
jgi:dihydroxyacetone kinase, dhaK subunit